MNYLKKNYLQDYYKQNYYSQKKYKQDSFEYDFTFYVTVAICIGIIVFIIYRLLPSQSQSSGGSGAVNFDFLTDSLNCGSVGNNCNANGTNYICEQGVCKCPIGIFCVCSGSPCAGQNQTCTPSGCQCGNELTYCGNSDPYCYNLVSDNTHCGSCTNVCPYGQSCENGSCLGSEPEPGGG
jgi:hypothetical protein